MRRSRLNLASLVLAGVIPALVPLASSAGSQASRAEIDEEGIEAGGNHIRLLTENGPIHVWSPAGYDAEGAGIIIYVHGYYTSVDAAWTDHRLAEQFQASGRNALFVVPEAPQGDDDPLKWESLGEMLEVVRSSAGLPWPRGPVVVIGHSGAYRTMVAWLRPSHITCLIMLDALYRQEREFRAWLRGPSNPARHRMILVGYETARTSERFARRFQGRLLPRVPDDFAQFTARERRARVLCLRSQYDHMEIVTGGKVIPLLLRLTSLPPV